MSPRKRSGASVAPSGTEPGLGSTTVVTSVTMSFEEAGEPLRVFQAVTEADGSFELPALPADTGWVKALAMRQPLKTSTRC